MRVPWTKMELRWRETLCAAMIPASEQGSLPGSGDVDTEDFWKEYEEAAPQLLRVGLRSSVWALTFCPVVYLRTIKRFEQLTDIERDTVLRKMSQSQLYLIRQLPLTIKLMTCFAYLRDDDVRAQVGQRSSR